MAPGRGASEVGAGGGGGGGDQQAKHLTSPQRDNGYVDHDLRVWHFCFWQKGFPLFLT